MRGRQPRAGGAREKRLKTYVKSGRVSITQADALHLPFKDNSFDGAFICWLLEHVQNPVGILAEAKRALKPGGVIFCNECSTPPSTCTPILRPRSNSGSSSTTTSGHSRAILSWAASLPTT